MISIIIPIYNKEQYIEKCVDSILSQKYKDYEVILVNDGSTDNSLQICKECYSKINNIKIITQKNQGVSAARNTGILNAKGENIIFIDADDEIEEGYLENLSKNVNDYDLTICGCNYFIEEKKKLVVKKFDNNLKEQTIGIEQLIKVARKGLLNALWNKIFNKSIIDEHNIRFDEKISLGEDLLFIIEYIKYINTRIYIINKPLYHYTLRKAGINLNSKEKIYDKINRIMYTEKQFEELYKKHKINNLKEIKKQYAEELILVVGRYLIKNNRANMREKKGQIMKIIRERKDVIELLSCSEHKICAFLYKNNILIFPYIIIKLFI